MTLLLTTYRQKREVVQANSILELRERGMLHCQISLRTRKKVLGIRSRSVVSMTLGDRAVIDRDTQVMFDLLPDFTEVRFDVLEVCIN